MNDKPILFNTQMVKAILEGRKTQTRRVIKNVSNSNRIRIDNHTVINVKDPNIIKHAPYQVGMKLWVRETWTDHVNDIDIGYALYKADMPMHWDAKDTEFGIDVDYKAKDFKWKPSIHMPKAYAHIWLEVTNVRVERIQDIKYEDCLKEGLKKWEHKNDFAYGINPPGHGSSTGAFHYLWDSINLERGYSWESNPYVWVISFRRSK